MNIEKTQNNQDSLKSIGGRLQLPSPPFFNRIMIVCAGIIATAGAVLLIPVTLPIVLPSIVITLCTHAIISATIAMGVAKTAVNWSEVEKKQENKTP